jgi:hypothetical protein
MEREIPVATDYELHQRNKARQEQLANPYNRSAGTSATLGHLANDIIPGSGNLLVRGAGRVSNLVDSADVAAGNFLHKKVGLPQSWTLTEERMNMGHLPPGVPGIIPTKRIYTHRASAPLSRIGAIAALGSLGLWAKKKLLDSNESEPSSDQYGGVGMTRTASHTALTNSTPTHIVEAQKFAAVVIDQQSRLISELHSAHNKTAQYAAALAQAVKLAQDGAIDVGDVFDHAKRLIASGSVKLSAADDAFEQQPGDLVGHSDGQPQENGQRLDPLTSFLRNVR